MILLAQAMRLCRRASSRRDLPPLARSLRRRDPRRHWHHRDPAHLSSPIARGPRVRAPPGSVPGYEATILDEQGAPVRSGTIGNLRVKGDSTMAFYWNQHEQTKDALRGLDRDRRQVLSRRGWLLLVLRSQRRHAQGGRHLGLAGRGRGGPRRASRRARIGVVGRDDRDGLLKPQAFVVLKERALASQALAEELKGFVKSRLAPYKYPRWIDFVDELPKTATGKIQRFKLRHRSPEERPV